MRPTSSAAASAHRDRTEAMATLAELSQRMEEALLSVGDDIAGAGRLFAGYVEAGKRLRGCLALLPATVVPGSRMEGAVRYATFVELIHAGTLCHDDVIDRCQVRRGRPSVNAAAGSRAAALAGLFLMWRAYELVAAEPPEVRAQVAAAADRVAEGQAEEMTDLWLEVPIERYLTRQRKKTSTLFELAAWLGARAAHLDERDAAALVHHACDLGLAFQLSDDLDDVLDPPAGGRPPGTDLREGVMTLPVLIGLANRSARTSLTKSLAALQLHGDLEALADCRRTLLNCGAVERAARRVADAWAVARASADAVQPGELAAALLTLVERARAGLPLIDAGWTERVR